MRKAENVKAPNLAGFAIGAAAGLVAFGVLVIVGEFDLVPAVAIAGGIAAVAGLILGMPWSAADATAPMRPPVAAADEAAAQPKAAKPKAEEPKVAGPLRLKAARKGKADNLKEIEGIGPAMEKLVNEMGFYHFDQIASWSDADVALVDAEMKTFKGRITRDKWVAQAKIIVTEGLEAFRERAKTNNY